jgi:ATP-dependent helicase HepA
LFCIIKERERDGLAKLVREGAISIVEYFDSPTENGRVTLDVPRSSVVRKRLVRNTRVYAYQESGNRWRVGRVQDDDGEGLYVRFAHKEDHYIEYADAFVRWKRPIANPSQFLARFITETPHYAEARSAFLQNYIEQRGAAFGIKALLSSSVELNPHQIDVVRRVLSDASQRYLLADEVGLGKTIEAGIIIRQAVLDDPNHRIVILVPEPLVRQWRHELISRFGLQVFLDESVFVLPQEVGRRQISALEGVTLLVVDEAHHVAAPDGDVASAKLYELLRRAASSTERLLLLSATPILRNEAGFLRMLHLLDPVVYPLDDYEGFKLKIEHRQALAEVVAMLVPDNALFLDEPLDDLAARLPTDERLQGLVRDLKNKLIEMPDDDDEDLVARIRQLRAHISETYRLNRRILRNRRKHVIGLTPNRDGAQSWSVSGSRLSSVESALEEWRIAACAACSVEMAAADKDVLAHFYWEMATACVEDPRELLQLCVERRGLPAWPSGEAIGRFEQENELLERLIAWCDGLGWFDARCSRLIEGLRSLPSTSKAVVFCSKPDIADALIERLKDARLSAVRHRAELDEEGDLDKAESWTVFMTETGTDVLVCDRGAEEGLNLQGGNKTVIHFDLPPEPNRIEQRMGRVDRYGAGNQIRSFVLLDQGAPLQQAWFDVLKDGWCVFDQSISSLQYLVEDELESLKKHLFVGGAEALQDLAGRLAGPDGLVASELKLIDQQDALDELSPLPESEIDRLSEVDDEWRGIRDAMQYWICDTLLFSAVPVPDKYALASIDQPVRFQYHPPESSSRATLIALTGFLSDFLGAIDYEAPGSRATQPRSFPHAARRATAVKRSTRLLRYGDEFVEAVKAFSDIDDRGRSFAMWRQMQNGMSPGEFKMCFRFDFLVEARLTKAEAVMAATVGGRVASTRAVLARRGDSLLAPFLIRIWLDEDGDELTTDFVEKGLEPKYEKGGCPDYIDKNLGREHFQALKRLAPDEFANWHERCLRMHDRARALALARPALVDQKKVALERAQAEDDVRHAQWRSRIRSLTGAEAQAERDQFDLEWRLNDALYEGIANPELKTDVAGVVFLSEQSVSVLEPLMGGGE